MEGLKPGETLYRWYSKVHAGPNGRPTSYAYKPRPDEQGLSFWRGDEWAVLAANPNTGIAAISIDSIRSAYSAEGVEVSIDVRDDGHVLIKAVEGKAGYRVARVLAQEGVSRVVRLPPV